MSKFATFKLLVIAAILMAIFTGVAYFTSPANFPIGVIFTVILASVASIWKTAFEHEFQ